ncbi:MAGUK p55 subfamily member 7 [Halotydeus destructor]|nr:MAGUK p55 subfamily member 7 [Halotydeus destructor]
MELIELNSRTNSSNVRPMQTEGSSHREMPVDVPESFVGMVKQHPRYPPPPPRTTSTSSPVSQPEPEKIRKYQEEVSKKKADEEFLRSSLRGSKKLQQLEKKKSDNDDRSSNNILRPVDNVAFEPDAADGREGSEINKVLPLPDLEMIVSRLAQHVNEEAKEMLEHSKLSKLISLYKSIMQQKLEQHSLPSLSSSSSSCDLVQEIITLLQEESSLNSEAAELLEILTRFELEGLCYAFDHIMVAEREKKNNASSHSLAGGTNTSSSTTVVLDVHADSLGNKHRPSEKDEAKETANMIEADIRRGVEGENADPSVRVVRIEKSSQEPLGATVKNEPDGSVLIGRIVRGGAAEKSGLLHEGDEVLEVNGVEMKGKNVNVVCDILAEMTGTLTFVIAVRDSLKPSATSVQQVMHLKALFDYDPDDDVYIPCKELGICFTKGDILHVIDQRDPNWWQAYREGEHDQSLAGLIPSANFQLQREAMKQSILGDSNNTAAMNYKNNRNHKKSSASSLLLNCGKRSHQRRKKRKSQLFATNDEILTYEEVSLYYPRANIKRPIVLIGPTNIGRHELRQRLMQDTERFAAAVPHTSRTRRDGEHDAIDYHFISRQQFEQDIKDGRFVEHGEYEKNYYGTSLSAIEAVVQSGKICVLNLHVHSIPILRQGHAGAKLKPYFVFVAPPTQMDKLSRLISSTGQLEADSGGERGGGGNGVSMGDLQAIIDEAREIESRYGHFFDMVLSIVDIDRAYQELLREINALEREPQWIANIWMK